MIKNEAERGWLAGLFEGEGYFGLKKDTTYKTRPDGSRSKYTYVGPVVELQMQDLDIIERVQNLISFPKNITIHKARKEHHNVTYRLTYHGMEAIEVMLTLRDLLGERRRGKIDDILATERKVGNV